MKASKKRLSVIALFVAFILLIPFTAMQFTNEVNWNISDFAIMGSVLFSVAFAYELIANRSEQTIYKIAFALGLTGAFLLFWVNGAVGIIGNEGQSANLLFGAVFVVGLVGSLLARFKAGGMARTMFAATATQMLVPLIALIIWPPSVISWSPGIFGVFLLSSFFALLFLVSAILFLRASKNNFAQIPGTEA